ncbi:MAG: exodeoxyribonuclease VII small subunit [Bacilli bacterium]|nr:exodeoxyribonuclease VII small subunit [Bacilli bacterium]
MEKKEEKTFEEALNSLEVIVKDLESGQVPLDDAINKFTEAMKLSKSCNEKLKNAEANINKILKENGKLEEFSIEE